MKIIYGDLIELAKSGQFDVIVHGCNCFCTMGAGIAKQIKDNFPAAYAADLKTIRGDKTKLGKISFDVTSHGVIIVNGYTQYHYGSPVEGINLNYAALKNVFKKVKQKFKGLRIAYPMIGSGLAGGDWKVISKYINEELEGEDHTVIKLNTYDSMF